MISYPGSDVTISLLDLLLIVHVTRCRCCDPPQEPHALSDKLLCHWRLYHGTMRSASRLHLFPSSHKEIYGKTSRGMDTCISSVEVSVMMQMWIPRL